jgi:hypothetical protein
MKKENVVDLRMHRDKQIAISGFPNVSPSRELESAIQALIHRLRELGPIR